MQKMYPHKFTYFWKNPHIQISNFKTNAFCLHKNDGFFFQTNHKQLSKFYHVYENEQEDKNKYY